MTTTIKNFFGGEGIHLEERSNEEFVGDIDFQEVIELLSSSEDDQAIQVFDEKRVPLRWEKHPSLPRLNGHKV